MEMLEKRTLLIYEKLLRMIMFGVIYTRVTEQVEHSTCNWTGLEVAASYIRVML
jgi:hypothetical protein